jgi:hypothetical protein
MSALGSGQTRVYEIQVFAQQHQNIFFCPEKFIRSPSACQTITSQKWRRAHGGHNELVWLTGG